MDRTRVDGFFAKHPESRRPGNPAVTEWRDVAFGEPGHQPLHGIPHSPDLEEDFNPFFSFSELAGRTQPGDFPALVTSGAADGNSQSGVDWVL